MAAYLNHKQKRTGVHVDEILPGQSDVFIHVEGDDVLERKLAGLVELDQVSVDTNGRRTGGESENEGLGGSGSELLDALLDVLRYSMVDMINKKKEAWVRLLGTF